jgi:hypothetical protein
MVAGPEPVSKATGNVGGSRDAAVKEDAGGCAATYPFFTDQDDLLPGIYLSSSLPDLSQRDEERTFDIAQLPFERFADIDQEQVVLPGLERER